MAFDKLPDTMQPIFDSERKDAESVAANISIFA